MGQELIMARPILPDTDVLNTKHYPMLKGLKPAYTK